MQQLSARLREQGVLEHERTKTELGENGGGTRSENRGNPSGFRQACPGSDVGAAAAEAATRHPSAQNDGKQKCLKTHEGDEFHENMIHMANHG